MSNFGNVDFGEGTFGTTVSPDAPVQNRIAWTFYDGVVTYSLPVNPQEASMPTNNKVLTFQATCSGTQIIFQGKPETKKISFSGVILEEEQYLSFRDWFLKRKQVQVTDDLGLKYWIYLKSFSPTRNRNNTYDWYMSYSAEGIVLDRG